MKPYDPILFLIGHSGAIRRIAGSYWSLLVGFILVLTAGVARNYDHLSFTDTLEWAIGPIVASLVSCTIVFALGMRRVWMHPESKLSFPSFLSVYWMTAPCAWLYAIPVEAYTDIVTATQWNITFLAVVALWRVALMVRCLVVLTGLNIHWATLSILLPANMVTMVGSFYKGISLVGIMGGVRLPPETVLLREAASFTTAVSFWLFITLFIIKLFSRSHQPKRSPKPLPWLTKPPFPLTVILTSLLILIASITLSSEHQRKVKNHHTLNHLLQQNKYTEAIDFLKTKKETDFTSIHYFPPGSIDYFNSSQYKELMKLPADQVPDWARHKWLEQYTDWLIWQDLHIYDLVKIDTSSIPVKLKLKELSEDKLKSWQKDKDLKIEKESVRFTGKGHSSSTQYELKLTPDGHIKSITEFETDYKSPIHLWPTREDPEIITENDPTTDEKLESAFFSNTYMNK